MFCYLSNNLPSRFKPYVTQIQGILPMLRSGEHPVVLTHGDLNEMNILQVGKSQELLTGLRRASSRSASRFTRWIIPSAVWVLMGGNTLTTPTT